MPYHRYYRRRNRYGDEASYQRQQRRGLRISTQTLRLLAIGVVLFVLVAILLRLNY